MDSIQKEKRQTRTKNLQSSLYRKPPRKLMRQMIAGQAPLDSKVVRRIPRPGREKNTDAPEEKNTSEKRYPKHRHPTTEKNRRQTPKRLLERSRPDSGVKRSRCRISNARSSRRWIAVTARQSMSAPEPSTKYRKYSTC